jgi:predicted nucleic acid-binding protein
MPRCRYDNILAIAVTGNCEYIITGDKDLLTLQHLDTITIINPGNFLEQEARE